MDPSIWLAFAIASTLLLLTPGPTVLLVVSYTMGLGRRTGWATAPGVVLGDFTAMTVSLMGAGAVLSASATLFTLLKYAGAAYLIWLGIRLWRAEPVLGDLPASETLAGRRRGRTAMFWHAFLVTALNPKSIVFFVAFLPQFVDPARALLPQFAILEATFLLLAGVNVGLWALLASGLRARFRQPSTLRLVNRMGAGVLIGAGLLTATLRRP